MEGTQENPYLSSIMISRNDDYGGNATRRMQVSIQDRLEQLEEHKIESEFILIEWNPPADRPSLKDVIKWPTNNRYCTIRIITVPPETHSRYEYSDRLNINAVVAINSGIRRARGQFVLPGNIDLIYSDELMAYIAEKKLKEDERYRIDRCDVDKDVIKYVTLNKQLKYCREHIIQVHNAHTAKKSDGLPALHTNASGDFQLMSRQRWIQLRGYRESDIISSYADGLLSFASYAAGIKEVVLQNPLRLYHIDHEGKFNERQIGSGLPMEKWLRLPFLPEKLNNAITRAIYILLKTFGYRLKGSIDGIPTLHFSEYRRMAKEMVKGKRSYVLNDENWGLGNENLLEYVINTAEWDRDYGKN